MEDEIRIQLENLRLKDGDEETLVLNKIKGLLQLVTNEANERRPPLISHLVNEGIIDVLTTLLQKESSIETQAKSAELIAELVKTDLARRYCTNRQLISLLIKLLQHSDPQVSLQGCRSLGNICYDNNDGRNLVNENNGTEALLHLLKSNVESGEETNLLRVIATGFLFNLTNSYESTQEKVLKADIINTFCELLDRFPQDEDLCTHILLTLSCIIETELGRQKFKETNMCKNLIKLLETEISSEVTESALDLLTNLAENDAMKFELATSNLCSVITKLIKKHQCRGDDDSIEIVKSASELVIFLLTGDDSMVHLYHAGLGPVYLETIAWLDSQDEALKIAGALAIGNFATKDEHCIEMVASGVTNKLTSIIREHSTREGDIRLQHAVLGALRNLAIPAVNKPAMISNGVVDAILPMTSVETFPVVFKLLATLRMLIDKQDAVAISLGQNDDFLQRLIEWCNTDDHPGVKGEATRLLAWIIKNSKSSDVMRHVCASGGMPFLVAMAISEHSVMQNESLIALTLIASSILDVAETDINSAGLVDQLKKLLNSDNIEDEVKSNTLTLITALFCSEKIARTLKESDICVCIQGLTSHANPTVNALAKKIDHLFESS